MDDGRVLDFVPRIIHVPFDVSNLHRPLGTQVVNLLPSIDYLSLLGLGEKNLLGYPKEVNDPVHVLIKNVLFHLIVFNEL